MKQKRVNRRLLILLTAAVFVVVLGIAGVLTPVQSALGWVTRPFVGVTSATGATVVGWWNVVGTAGKLASDNQHLRNENASLRQQISQDTELRAQNDELRKQLGVGSVRADKLTAAEVIGYQPDNFRQFLTIGRGSADGLSNGMAVVSQGALVGTLQDVTPTTSKVFLVIDPTFRVTALDQDAANRPTGTIRGQIGNGLIMDKIAQNEAVKPGDTIVTTGTGAEIPKGLIIGHIQTVDKKDNGVFQTAQVTSDIAFNRLEIVYIVTRP
jgi:rod shape-determining protein MreC